MLLTKTLAEDLLEEEEEESELESALDPESVDLEEEDVEEDPFLELVDLFFFFGAEHLDSSTLNNLLKLLLE